jgi:hypothetical protein
VHVKKLLQSLGSIIAVAIAGFALWQYIQIGDLGDSIEDKGVELYYTDNVKKGEADALLKYLVESGFADGTDKTLQLDRGDEKAWVVRAVVEEKDAEPLQAVFIAFARELSGAVFEGAPVIIHLCDENMKTHKAMEPVAMSVIEREQVELYYSADVEAAEADALLTFLLADGFGDGTPKSLAIEHPAEDRWLLRIVVIPGFEKDEEYAGVLKFFGVRLAAEVFGGTPVEIHMTDDMLTTLRIVPPTVN